MPRDYENYNVAYALQNIGDYFWRLYNEDLLVYAKECRREIVERIHQEWNSATGCLASGTDIRIRWAIEIYNHGDWAEALKMPVPPYKKYSDPIVTIDPRRKYPAEYRCDNSIYVRSLSELCIANWLYANRTPFEYERKVYFSASNESALCDFYLPDYNAYIEFWGLSNDKNYEYYKRWKENNYRRNIILLISLYPNDLKNLRDRITSKLINL